jgi:ABC-2 type transport system permease protein
MGAIGIALAAGVLVFKRAELLSVLVTYAISTFGGAVFPVSVFPDWLERLTVLIPARYAFDGARAALFTGEGWAGDAAVLAAFSAVGLPLSLALFAAALRLAKRRGSLALF